jgi:hypothetical protein
MGDAWWTEATDRVRLCIEGTLFGVPISAQADAIKKDLSEIADHKFPSDFSVQWRKAKGGQLTRTTKVGADYCVQLNIIRLLLAQQPWAIDAGYDPLNVMMTVWDHATGKDQGPEPLAVSDYMSEEEIAAYRPGGETTVAEITQWLAYIKQEHKGCTTMKDRERLAAGIPLIGLPMLGGNKCQHYCEVSEKCGTLSRQYGVPETVDEAA